MLRRQLHRLEGRVRRLERAAPKRPVGFQGPLDIVPGDGLHQPDDPWDWDVP